MLRFDFARLVAVALAAVIVVSGIPAKASEPNQQSLQEKIDACLETAAVGPLARQCSDSDFLRRIYLDLVGVIPNTEQAQSFLQDQAQDKRARLVDQLLGSIESSRHLAIQFNVLFLERRTEASVKQSDWEQYLLESLASDKPLDQVVSELVYSQPQHPANKFLMCREGEPNAVTRDVGRLVFGMDLQCAQCHDHPLVDSYLQEDYYGLYAFFHRTSLFTNPKDKSVQLAEKAQGEANFKSVFTGYSRERANPRVPKEFSLFDEPVFATGQEYRVKPDKNVAGEPKFSRRAALARQLSNSSQFHRNLANRIWALMFSRGVVHPLDLHHPNNPPFNPALLDLLAQELKANGRLLRPILRAIALTRTYQRSCEAPHRDTLNYSDIAARSKQLLMELENRQMDLPALQTNAKSRQVAYQNALELFDTQTAELAKLEAAIAAATQHHDKLLAGHQQHLTAHQKALSQLRVVSQAREKVAEAAKAIADDKVLADAAARLAERATHWEEKVKPLEQKTEEGTQLVDAARAELLRLQNALTAAQAARISSDQLTQIELDQVQAANALIQANYEVSAIEARLDICRKLLDFRELQYVDPSKADNLWHSIMDHWTIHGQVAPLKPLSPEQLASSAMQATGYWGKQLADVQQKLKNSPTESLQQASDSEQSERTKLMVQLGLVDSLRGQLDQFAALYGGSTGEDFQATVNQALFFGNGTVVDQWLKPSQESLTGRLADIDSAEELADLLYLSVLSRHASDQERSEVAQTLAADNATASEQRQRLIAEWIWALLSSNEFRFNH